MLVTSRHAEIFATEQFGDGVDVSALHPHPAGGGMAEVVEAEVGDLQLDAEALEGNADLRGLHVREEC